MPEDETANDITEELTVTIDPDGEGGMPPIDLKFKLGKNAYFLVSVGFIIGFLVRHGLASVM